MSFKKLKRLVTLLVLTPVLFLSATACQTTGSDGINLKPTVEVSPAYCTAFKPVYWSKQDTRETQEQIVEHNRVYKALCPDEVKSNGGG